MSSTEIFSAPLDLTAIRARLADSTQRQYWRSLEEAAAAPEFQALVEREFPTQLAVWNDPLGRRKFLKLMAASLALAGVTGCTRAPDEAIVPYVKQPPEITPGLPLYFATAVTRSGYALGLLAESHMGRPTKLEGNPEHPASLGATDVFAQASILGLYDPDRSQTIVRRGVIETWDRFITTLSTELESLRSQQGEGLRILTENITSPTLGGQLAGLLADLPQARWHQYEPVGYDNEREGAQLAYGRDVDSVYHFEKAKVIFSLDADFLQELPGSVRYARDFIDGRRVSGSAREMSRLFVVESTPTITGGAADHRLPLQPSLIEDLARAVASRLGVTVRAGAARDVEGVPEAWIAALVKDLDSHRGTSLVIAGSGQPPLVHALAHAINQALGNVGQTVRLVEPVAARAESHLKSLAALVADMQAGKVQTLLILGGNPAYNAPGELDFSAALTKVKLRVHLAEYEDETSFLCDWHVPAAHYLESWGDARAYDGTTTIQQPLIAPLYGGKSAYELLSILQGKPGRTSFEILQEHWKGVFGEEEFTRDWRKAIHDGTIADTQSAVVNVPLAFNDASSTQSATSGGQLEIEYRADPTVGDGRHANNGWLQELPKPLTKIVWDNVAMVSPQTSQQLGVTNGDVVEITLDGRSVQAPVWIAPGQANDCISLTLGYGRTRSGRVGTQVGYDAYALRSGATAGFAGGATVVKANRRHIITTTQNYSSMEGRDIVRSTTLESLLHPPAEKHSGHHGHGHGHELPTLYPEYETGANAWGMSIDQTACIGCNACVVACQAENNSPVVGKDQVEVGREMHWLRIDRYFAGELDNPEMLFQPMMCTHCENAPCEVVCPVAATVHDAEGTNNMVYNRCVGTRYCSNNCPYKVRRFNFLQYSDETTPSLQLARNPDVTVRSRGVMEKCTYCIQRVSVARIEAKKENRPIRDGDVVTACQQACPTRAIVFGNLNDPKSEVRQLKESPLDYGVLAELGTKPRTTHLTRVSNPHPDLAPASAHGSREAHS